VPLELPAQALELAAGEDGSAVLALQLVLLLGDLRLPLLQVPELFLLSTMFFKLGGEQGLKSNKERQERRENELFWFWENLHTSVTS